MRGAGRKMRGDFGSREKAISTLSRPAIAAAIIARAAALHEIEPGAGEKGVGVLLQPAFRRHGENERRLFDSRSSPRSV